MPSFKTLGGTVSITSEQVIIDESVRQRVWNHVKTDPRVQIALLALVLVFVSILLWAPSQIWFLLRMIGLAAGIYAALVIYARLTKGSQHRDIVTNQITKAYLRENVLWPPRIVFEYTTPDGTQKTKPILLQSQWVEDRTEPEEILSVLEDSGVPVDDK